MLAGFLNVTYKFPGRFERVDIDGVVEHINLIRVTEFLCLIKLRVRIFGNPSPRSKISARDWQ